jgi:uncharacterized membrane protein YgcG
MSARRKRVLLDFLRSVCGMLFLAVLGAATASAQERIIDYRVEVSVQPDGALEVTEHIRAHAAGEQIRRGLYRDFPTRYEDRFGNAVVVDLEVIDLQRDGEAEPWFTENRDNGVRINFGDDDFLEGLPRVVDYRLRYRTTRQLGFFEDFDELYWNAIGTGWVFPIEAGGVEVRLPQEVVPSELRLDGYSGPQGAGGRDFVAEVVAPGVARWRLNRPLPPYHGLTVVLGFPKGLVDAPSALQRFGWLLADNRGLLIAFAGLVLLLVYCVRRWRQVGRDPDPGIIIARYEAPAGRSPAELRYLLRMGYDTRCLTSDLVAGAVAGCVEIEREERWLRRDRWTLQRRAAADSGLLADTQRALLEKLLPASKPRLELSKSNATASHLQSAISVHKASLHRRLHGSHFQSNLGSVAVAALIAVAAGGLGLVLSGGHGELAIIGLCALMAVCVLVFAWLVRAPTAEGRKLLDEIEGLKLYLSVAEREELARMRGPGTGPPQLDAQRYQQLLPYAIALEVEEAWTGKFTAAVGAAAAAEATRHIGWYHGGGFNSLGEMTQAVSSSLNSSIASASSPPGSSSGGGGGGSSGGGGGGCGGGGR